MRRSVAKQALNVILRGTRTNAIFEWEQREEHFKKPDMRENLGYKRIAANMKSKKRSSKLPEEWEVIPNTQRGNSHAGGI